MATRNAQINSIVKLATESAERDLQTDSVEGTPEMLALIAAVTDQIKQRAGDNQGLNDLVAMIESALPEVKAVSANGAQAALGDE
jgi:hypothetical protein